MILSEALFQHKIPTIPYLHNIGILVGRNPTTWRPLTLYLASFSTLFNYGCD